MIIGGPGPSSISLLTAAIQFVTSMVGQPCRARQLQFLGRLRTEPSPKGELFQEFYFAYFLDLFSP